MHFMPHANWTYRMCASLPSYQRYGLTLFFLTSLWGAWYYGVYRRMAHIETSSYAEQNNTQQCAESALEDTVIALRNQVYNYNKAWKDNGIDIFLTYAARAGLQFISSDIVSKQHEQHVQDSITLQATGTLKQCCEFLNLLSTSDVHCICDQIDIAASDSRLYKLTTVITVKTGA